MQDLRVAKRYAKALFEVSQKLDVVQSVEADLTAISNLLANDPKFRSFVLSPHVARDEKIRIAERLFSDRVTALTMRTLRLMLEKRREAEIDAVREVFVELRRDAERVLLAIVTSAEALEQHQRTAIENRLAEKTGKRIEAEYRIDPKLIGGVKVAIGNYELDGTLRGQLRKIREKLTRDVLKQA